MIYFRPGFVCRSPLLVAWNQQDKTSNIDLSNGLLTATCNASPDGAVRATIVRAAGKWYAEINGVSIGGGDGGIGFANASAVLANIGGSVANAFIQFRSGNTYANGTLLFNNGGMGAGGIVQLAYDGTAHLGWLRFNGGNWNANASNNPATGVGGVNVSAWDSGGLFPCFAVSVSGDNAILNGGATSFSYAVPSGFSNWNTS